MPKPYFRAPATLKGATSFSTARLRWLAVSPVSGFNTLTHQNNPPASIPAFFAAATTEIPELQHLHNLLSRALTSPSTSGWPRTL